MPGDILEIIVIILVIVVIALVALALQQALIVQRLNNKVISLDQRLTQGEKDFTTLLDQTLRFVKKYNGEDIP